MPVCHRHARFLFVEMKDLSLASLPEFMCWMHSEAKNQNTGVLGTQKDLLQRASKGEWAACAQKTPNVQWLLDKDEV